VRNGEGQCNVPHPEWFPRRIHILSNLQLRNSHTASTAVQKGVAVFVNRINPTYTTLPLKINLFASFHLYNKHKFTMLVCQFASQFSVTRDLSPSKPIVAPGTFPRVPPILESSRIRRKGIPGRRTQKHHHRSVSDCFHNFVVKFVLVC
jgi:hypothetical protein